MRESNVEKALRLGIESLGGTCEKFVVPNRKHVPDRLITVPFFPMELVETKAPGKKPRTGQTRDHKRRRAMGVTVLVIDTLDKVEDYVWSWRVRLRQSLGL